MTRKWYMTLGYPKMNPHTKFGLPNSKNIRDMLRTHIAPDKAAYCVFTQFRGPENAIKFISVRTKTQLKSLIRNFELF